MENDVVMNPDLQPNPNSSIKISHEAKLTQLLRNLTSIDLQLCAESSKEFMKLLKSDEGGEVLRKYVHSSPNCSELIQAWNLRQSKPGLSYIMSLINVLLSHRDGVYRPNDVDRVSVSRVLDKFARFILEEKIGDVYKELNSKESKGKNGALLLMSSIVRRGSGLAADVAKSFNFKLPNFLRLAEYDKRRKNVEKVKRKISTRRSFVRFAMSFLEIGDSRLLRWILQQKEMFSGVLRGLGSDEDETVVYVLSTLRDKVLVPESLVPVGLRSVLFGSVTLEQLVDISGRNDGGDAAEVAKKVLFMVCNDPCNGLMPDPKALPFPLKGNLTRLLGVMKKLKATENEFHRDLLLSIVRGRPSFGSAYLEEFPYSFEDHSTWFAAVSLAANLISSVNAGSSFDFLDSQPGVPPSFNSSEVQCIIKCIGPRPFNRIVINKGLLHSESRIQHGTLRLVLEALKLLDSLFSALNQRSISSKQIESNKWASLKQEIQNEVQLLLPDHQVLLSLISSLSSRLKNEKRALKRNAATAILPEHSSSNKKSKTRASNDETDIVIGGISSLDSNGIIQEDDNMIESDNLNDDSRSIIELWKSHESNNVNIVAEDEESYFYSKLLDALKVYHRTMPSVLEGSFDFFKVLPSNALSLPTILQQSLLSLLVEHIGWSSKQDIPIRYPPQMYKHLSHFINLAVNSPVKDIKDQAYELAKAAMLSSGAFDKNEMEINAWLMFLPGFTKGETIQNFSSVVLPFFCDAVSTVGNNLFKYLDLLQSQIYGLELCNGNPRFSPLCVCVIEKCLRLLGSDSGSFSLPEKSMISVYVSNSLRYLLQTQVESDLLATVIYRLLRDKLETINDDLCEWRPLQSLCYFSMDITDTGERCIICKLYPFFDRKPRKTSIDDDSFLSILGEVKSLAENELNSELTTEFSLSMLCASPDLISQHFPSVISISENLNGIPFSILSSICFLETKFLHNIFKSWPELWNSSEAFSYFLKWVPFYVLFPAIMSIECSLLSESTKLQELLMDKLSKEMSDDFVSSFRIMFFWFRHMQSSYCNEHLKKFIKSSEVCFVLIKSMLEHSSANQYSHEIAETIFCHRAVGNFIESPLSVDNELKVNVLDQPTDNFLSVAQGLHIMDYHVLQVLELFCNKFSFTNDVSKRSSRVFIQKLVLKLKSSFDQFIESKNQLDMIPTVSAFYTLIRFISPQQLLELVSWMFSRIDHNESSVPESFKVSAFSVGLNIAGCAFDFLLFSGLQEFDVSLFEKVYFHIVKIASHSDLVLADLCLLKAVKIASRFNGQSQSPQSLPNHMALSRVVASTPMSLLSNCFQKTSMIKSQLLFHLTESNIVYLSFFGLSFMDIVNKSSVGKCDEDLINLLPTALSFMNFISVRSGEKCDKHLSSIRSLYWGILSNGFCNFNNFVSKDLFQVKLEELVPSSVEDLYDLFNNNLLGRSVAVLRDHIMLSGSTVKQSKRLKLFDSIIPSGNDNLLDCNALEIDHYSIEQSLNLIMKAVTKVLLCKMLIFSSSKEMSKKEYSKSVMFVNSLVSTWLLIVKKFRLEVEGPKHALFRLLENFILRILVEVNTEMHKNSDIKSNSVLNLEQLAKSCLRHRFEDPATLNMLQVILAFEEDKSLHIQILQLLLSHSQFATNIHSGSESSSSQQFGIIFRPVSSILRSLTFARTNRKSHPSEFDIKQLEIVKLLKELCHFKAGLEQETRINIKELQFLLLSSYGATCSEKDWEIYKIMQELESFDYIADMDYLWGTAATRVRKIRETEQAFSTDDVDEIEKHRKSQFRENLPIEPKMCADTVLHFPYDRNISVEALSTKKLLEHSGHVNEVEIYDPVFILRMSFHGLSKDYVDPIEYASLGLLAVALVSLSSPDDEIRKLGYKVLAVFRDALEISQKRKEVNRLRPLLNYVQNGISEAWQKIPSVHALFAAEASVLLLDPSNNHYKTITKLLLHSPMHTKTISFFDEFFWSNSVNFKSDRIWILRLLYCGLNLEDDALIYIRSSILEKLLSFYSSSLSDNESNELILQIVKKSMKFVKTSRHLVEHCGVISWLSSLISSFSGNASQLAVILKVVNDVVNSRNASQWLETHSVEQLTQLSCHLHMLFVDNFDLVKDVHLIDSVLEVIASTLNISQKRDPLQPHFTFSVDSLYQLSQSVDVNCNTELGLKVILMTTPQAALLTMDGEKLQKFVLWAVSIALRADEQTIDSLVSKLLPWLTASVILARNSCQSKYNLENSVPETLQSLIEAEWSVSRVAIGCEEVLASTIYYLQQILGRKCEVLTSVVTSLCLLLFPDGNTSSLTSLLSRVQCPPEANPSWRWSFDMPLKNPSSESRVDELQACQSILVVVSNILGKKSSLSHFISDLDIENSGVFEWESSFLAESL